MVTYMNNNHTTYYCGISTKPKPLTVMNGAIYFEINTGLVYMFDEENKIWYEQKLGGGSGGGEGTLDHNLLTNRNLPNQHPIAAIVGLQAALDKLTQDIAGIGTVFDLKGSKATVNDLPTVGNTVGDVWYVVEKEVGYIWIEKNGVLQWEPLGPTVDLTGYIEKAKLAQDIGDATDNTMSQKAITDKLNLKADKTTVTSDLTKKADTSVVEGLATDVQSKEPKAELSVTQPTSPKDGMLWYKIIE